MSKTIKKTEGKKRSNHPPKVSKADIRKRAYEIYKSRKMPGGSPEDDWFRAEQELFSDPGY